MVSLPLNVPSAARGPFFTGAIGSLAPKMERLYGKLAEEAEKTSVPEIEFDTIHKYAF
jgi:hypothetical protein